MSVTRWETSAVLARWPAPSNEGADETAVRPILQTMGLRISRIAAATAAAGVALFWTTAALACGSGGYSYAGIQSRTGAYGIGALLTPLIPLSAAYVTSGHIAGWVGVGGPGQGPQGQDEWLQVGLAAFPETQREELYYELTLPGSKPTYHQLAPEWPLDKSVRVALLEMRARPNHWRVWVNGRARTAPIALPASHGRFRPMATAESHDAGTATCNTFLYRFHHVTIARAPGGRWRSLNGGYPISDPATRLRQDGLGAFLAAEGETAFGLMGTLIP